MKIKILAFAVTLSLVFSGILIAVEVEAVSGKETQAPKEIHDWYDLNEVRDNLSEDYVLMSNLNENTNGYDNLVDTEYGWEPIADFDNSFTGTFDGQGHTISDLYIDSPEKHYVGLFGSTNGSEIKNVGLEEVDIERTSGTGGLVGRHSEDSKIEDSYVTGSIRKSSNIGGLVGVNHRSEIKDSYAEVEVTGGTTLGGLVGSNVHSSEIYNSYATRDIQGEKEVGGLVGVNRGESEIHNSYATGDVTGEKELGGLVGVCRNEAEIHNSYATGDVIGEKHTIGGLVGTYHFGNEIHNSYATGDVSGNSSVGGLIGENAGSTVSNSYAKGRVSGEDYVGGLIGGNYNGTVETSYADENTTGQTDLVGADQYGTFTGSELLTTAEMTGEEAQENMSGFDFEETWETVDGSHKGAIEDGYPILQDLSREKQLKAQDVYQYDGEDGFLSNYWWLIFPMVIAAVLAIGISIALNRERRAIQQPSQKRQRPPPSQRKSYQQQPPQKQQKAQQQLQSQEEPSKEEPSTEIPKEEAFVELSKLTGVGPSKAERLYENGFHTLEDLEGVSKEELQEVKGIGASLAEKILDSLEEVK